MTIYQRMASVFEHANVPGFLQEWRATALYPQIPERFATYRVSSSGEGLAADDMEIARRYQIWIDLYGETDVSGALETIMLELKGQGFYIGDVRDMDDANASRFVYHRRWQVTYVDYCWEE